MDGILGYTSLPRQQLLALDPNIYGGEPFRHGLTPPQLGSEQMHSYGEEGREGGLTVEEGKGFLKIKPCLLFQRRLVPACHL